MVPESVLVALHEHEHTEAHEAPLPEAEHMVDNVHLHCDSHEFSFSEFILQTPFTIKVSTPQLSTLVPYFQFVWKFTFPNNIDLRGPPSLS
ncbi:hypothetical protein [Rufibacter roseus]|uniref:Uncharacterized protein n=1 Tax=Rufibacter roseus TaxID=1567108 RepID=A0ABW2DID8_9BACT|nr:hypothetical protein [Rufibacter roseus]